MEGWETVVAALGGLLFGLGLGLALSRRREARIRRRLTQQAQRLRAAVIPVLEERADALGLSADERKSASDEPHELAVHLAESIRRFTDARTLPFSDTLDAARVVLEESVNS